MTELHETTLCIEGALGITPGDNFDGLLQCPAIFAINEETGTAKLKTFCINSFWGTRDVAVQMTGPDHVRQQERLAWQAWQDGEGDRVRKLQEQSE